MGDPSLRDEAMAAARMFRYRQQTGYGASPTTIDYDMADAVLAVVRKHVETLDRVAQVDDHLAYLPDGDLLYRDDVLRLLGGDDE